MTNNNVYETDVSLDMYLGFHYPGSGETEGVAPVLRHDHTPIHALRFAQRVAEILVSLQPIHKRNAVLDIGCAVGGSAFELAKTFDHVDAFDLSTKFITMAKLVQSNPDSVQFRIPFEGAIHKTVTVKLDPDITTEIRQKVNFTVGDACNIPQMIESKQLQESYDGAILSNLLCRLPDPVACLNSLPSIISTDGIVVIVTPFTWLSEFTEANKWLGGYHDPITNEPIYSNDRLFDIMTKNGFEKVYEQDIPLVIREHQRKYQYIISLATGWRKI